MIVTGRLPFGVICWQCLDLQVMKGQYVEGVADWECTT